MTEKITEIEVRRKKQKKKADHNCENIYGGVSCDNTENKDSF
jgi:hypothetical protein